jgi:fructose-1,6-bisphosphatase/sedoheptulose 1,7-bisphosphatase-like protein
MDLDLSLDLLRVVEPAAIACAHTMDQGDRHSSDQVAMETMRRELDSVPIDGTVVIGEGERDEARMLHIGEKVGMANRSRVAGDYTAVDITDFSEMYRARDLASGNRVIFAETGVTEGTLMKGVRFFGDGTRTASRVMQTEPHHVRFIDSIHVAPEGSDVKLRF